MLYLHVKHFLKHISEFLSNLFNDHGLIGTVTNVPIKF